MNKSKGKLFCAGIIVGLFFILVIFMGTLLLNNRNVGTIKGSILYYNNKVYKESYDSLETNLGSCLGKITWNDTGEESRIYSIKGYPNYLYVDLIGDHRIYKIPE